MTRQTRPDTAATREADRLRRAAADSAAWSLFADGTDADELARVAHDARVAADELDGFLPLGVEL
jgi:hypothetical protein